MKKFALAAALSVAATTAFAGGAVEPVMTPDAVAPASSSSGMLVPLLLILVIAAAVASRSGT